MPQFEGSIALVNSTVLGNESCGLAAVKTAVLGRRGGLVAGPEHKGHAFTVDKLQKMRARSTFDLSFEGVRHFMGDICKEYCLPIYVRELKEFLQRNCRVLNMRDEHTKGIQCAVQKDIVGLLRDNLGSR
eukprot:scaffold111_cov404-Prasinococcus_capsulatus_cf.AAC.9